MNRVVVGDGNVASAETMYGVVVLVVEIVESMIEVSRLVDNDVVFCVVGVAGMRLEEPMVGSVLIVDLEVVLVVVTCVTVVSVIRVEGVVLTELGTVVLATELVVVGRPAAPV